MAGDQGDQEAEEEALAQADPQIGERHRARQRVDEVAVSQPHFDVRRDHAAEETGR